MKAISTLLLAACFASPGFAQAPAAPSVEDQLSRIHKNRLDGRVYQLRDLTLIREDVRIYFTEGTLAFLEPLNLEGTAGGTGRVLGALFVGEGEVLVMPPNIVEKRNLARFTGAPVLNEKLSSIFLRFTDDTAAQLLKGLAGRAAPEIGSTEFIEQWGPVVQNLNLMYDLRVLSDLLAGPQTPPVKSGFFAARLWGQRLGAIDIIVDQLAEENVAVSQVNWKDGKRYLDLWCSFAASSRAAGPSRSDSLLPRSYRIDAAIQSSRQMDVTAELELEAVRSGERALFFELSRFLKVSSVQTGATDLPFFQNEVGDESQIKQRGNDILMVVLPAPVEQGRRYRLRVKYSGEVISDAGNGVYFVGARGSWYPNRGYHPADFELTFRCPKNLRLVATGDRLEDREEGEIRLSRWKSRVPLRVAGFNIGEYVSSSAKASDGTVVEVYANRALETALESLRPRSVIVEPMGPPLPPGRRRAPVVVSAPPPPSPAAVAETIAKDQVRAMEFFIKAIGPLPSGRVAVSPIPGSFGQGWPGLVYLSTTSYLLPYDTGRQNTPESTEVFFKTILPVHELAHQWWGHVVRPASYREDWLIEALAAYTALIWLEQDGKAGPRQIRQMLERHRTALLKKTDDQTAESVGPPVLGHRLVSSKSPHGVDVVVYLKGPWILHMLRQLMRDPKAGSDAAFFKFLRALRDEYTDQPLTTAGFRATAERFVVPEVNAEKGRNLEWFFDQWVYGVGIPEVKVSAKVEAPRPAGSTAGRKTAGPARASAGKVTGTAVLAGVDDSWILPIPIYVQTVRGDVYAGLAVGEAGTPPEQTRFNLPLPALSQRAIPDPLQTLLAVWK